ncbi:MAG: glycosyltransferase family 1 protein [Candidatus Omnitrophota bacterium]
MNVLVDGLIFELQAKGGISRIFHETLARMCSLDPRLMIQILLSEKVSPLLIHERIEYCQITKAFRLLRSQRLWKPLVPMAGIIADGLLKAKGISDTKNKIWHSTYYTLPHSWRGPVAVTAADMIHELFPGLFKGHMNEQFCRRKRLCMERADAVICISETTRQDVIKLCNVKKELTFVVPLAGSEIFKPLNSEVISAELKTKKPFLLYIGSRVHYKNFDTFIKTYARWSLRNDIDLLLVGPALSEDEKMQHKKMGILDKVELLSGIDDAKLCQIYNRAVALVYPSLYEGFGIPLLEAMACGCPIVASSIPSNIEIAGDIPIFFSPNDEDELIRSLGKAVSESRKSSRIQDGFDRAKLFSWDMTAQKTLDIYKKLLHSKS